MSTLNICFCGEIRNIFIFLWRNKLVFIGIVFLSRAMDYLNGKWKV